MRSDIAPGALFPDYELSDHTGEAPKLSHPPGPAPHGPRPQSRMLLPKDRRQPNSQWNSCQLHREIEVGYCRLVTITRHITLTTSTHRRRRALPFSRSRTPRAKGSDIAEYTDPANNPQPNNARSPSSFSNPASSSTRSTTARAFSKLCLRNVTRLVFRKKSHRATVRQSTPIPKMLLLVLRRPTWRISSGPPRRTKKCRPDGHHTPELKKAWQEGTKNSSTLRQTYAQTLGEQD